MTAQRTNTLSIISAVSLLLLFPITSRCMWAAEQCSRDQAPARHETFAATYHLGVEGVTAVTRLDLEVSGDCVRGTLVVLAGVPPAEEFHLKGALRGTKVTLTGNNGREMIELRGELKPQSFEGVLVRRRNGKRIEEQVKLKRQLHPDDLCCPLRRVASVTRV